MMEGWGVSGLRKLGPEEQTVARTPNNIGRSFLRESRLGRMKWKSPRGQVTIFRSEDVWKECDTWVINKKSRKGPHGSVVT